MIQGHTFMVLFPVLCSGFNYSPGIALKETIPYPFEKKIAWPDSAKHPANNKDSAIAYYHAGLFKNNSREYSNAIGYFTEALKLDSTLVSAYVGRAHAKNKLLDYKGALKDYNRALQFPMGWEESYEIYFNKGLTQALLENLRSAMSDFNTAIKLNPKYADAYYNRSLIKGKVGDYHGELADINKAISLNPANANAFNTRGIVKSIMGNNREALLDFNQAILLDKTNAQAYFNRGIVYFEEKEYQAAVNDLSSAITIHPDADTYNRRANAKWRLNNSWGALEDYGVAIKTDPDFYIAYLNRGLLKYDLKDYHSAIDDFTRAIKIKPDCSIALYSRGLAKGKLKDFKGEIDDYSYAIEYKPDYQDAYYKRGLVKYSLDDKKGGCEDLNLAVKQGSNLAYDYLIEHCK